MVERTIKKGSSFVYMILQCERSILHKSRHVLIKWHNIIRALGSKVTVLVHSPQRHLSQPNWCLATSLILGWRSFQTLYFCLMSKTEQCNCYHRDLQTDNINSINESSRKYYFYTKLQPDSWEDLDYFR